MVSFGSVPNRPVGTDPRSISSVIANFDYITNLLDGGLGHDNFASGSSGAAKGVWKVNRSTAFTINTTATIVLFNNEQIDMNGWYDPTTGKYQPLMSGWYEFIWSLPMSTVDCVSFLYKNGALSVTGSVCVASATYGTSTVGHSIEQANGTSDFFDIRGIATVASALGTSGNFFGGHYIGKS